MASLPTHKTVRMVAVAAAVTVLLSLLPPMIGGPACARSAAKAPAGREATRQYSRDAETGLAAVSAETLSDTASVREREGGLVPIFFKSYQSASAAISRMGSLLINADSTSAEWRGVLGNMTHGRGMSFLALRLFSLALIVGAGLALERVFKRWARDFRRQGIGPGGLGRFHRAGRLASLLVLEVAQLAVYILVTFALFVAVYRNERQGYVLVAHCLLGSYYFRLIVLSARVLLAPRSPELRILPMQDAGAVFLYRWIARMALIATVIAVASIIFREAGMGETLFLMVYSLSGICVGLAALVMIWQSRERLRRVIAPTDEGPSTGASLWQAKLARSWHWLAMAYVIGITLFWQAGVVAEGRGRVIELFYGLFLIPLFIGIDHWSQKLLQMAAGDDSAPPAPGESGGSPSDSVNASAEVRQHGPRSNVADYLPLFRRVFRVLLVALLFFLLLRSGGIDLSLGRLFTSHALSILVVLLFGFLIWQFVKAKIDRKLREELPAADEEMEEGGAGGSRAGTLLLLLRKFILSVLFVLVALIILSSLGIDIGPLIAGAGVVGLAIGFGAQTLVKDIISGVFFLVDDAFRVGDYIETAGTKGMVEHISLRSLRLRHPRGMVHTIPFGDMGTVTNFSRDYIITKLDIRVRYDADLKTIKKLVKKINQQIRQDEELGRGLLGDIKSQGVREMDDSAMILRVKYKTIPGEQFTVRRELYRMIQEEFRANGIDFAHRNVTVHLPPEPEQGLPRETAIGAAAAAVLAAAEAERIGKDNKKDEA